MATVEIVDETVVVAAPEVLVRVLVERWAGWWPGHVVTLVADGGADGLEWWVSGPVVGTTQVRLLPHAGGTLVRYRLTADPAAPGSRDPRTLPDSPHGRREADALRRRHVLAWKHVVWSLKDELEA